MSVQKERMWWVCTTFNSAGKSECDSKAVPEETLIEVTKKVLGVQEVTIEIIAKRIQRIDVLRGNKLIFHLKNGKVIEETWKDLSRRNSWTPEMKEKARQRALAQHSRKAGNNNG